MKFLVMMGILVLALLNTQKLETNEVLLVGSIVTITFVILDTMVPSIEIKKE